jgi:predicted ester cyclase
MSIRNTGCTLFRTGRPLEFNGLDFWKLENDMYVENWVFVDMIHLFRQFGVDLFDRIPRR